MAVTQVLLLLLLLLFPVCFVDGGVNVRLLSLREIERAVTTFLNFSALTMKDDDEDDEDDDEKRGEGRESDENIVVVVVVEQAKNMSYFLQTSGFLCILFFYIRMSAFSLCRVCVPFRELRVQTYRFENKNAKTMR